MCKKIMIVEDEWAFHVLYEEILKNTDYVILHAYDGNDALAQLEKEKPDLIILDILLDMMTGDTFFLHLKSIPEYADIPVIIASSYPRQSYKSLMRIDPELVFLDKNCIGDKLINEVNARIGGKNLKL
jgi:CheY-like chemotaxis protein